MANSNAGNYGQTVPFSRLADDLQRAAFHFSTLVSQATLFSKSIQAFRTLERQLVNTNVVAQGTVKQFKEMERVTRNFALASTSTAAEAASALYFLASAGFSVEESLSAMTGVVTLAQATMETIAETSDVVASNIRAFGLEAEDSGRIANVFAAAIAKSQASLPKLAFALRQVGPVAKVANLSIEDTTAALSALFNIGLRGEQAGTALRNIIIRLADPLGEAREIMAELGIETLDTNFAMRNLFDIIKDLSAQNLPQVDLAKIGGQEALAGLVALMDATERGFIARFTDQITGTQEATRQALQQLNSLHGSMSLAGNAATELGIILGQSLSPVVRDLADGFTDLIIYSRQFDEVTKSTVGRLLTLTAVVGLSIKPALGIVNLLTKSFAVAELAVIAFGGGLLKLFRISSQSNLAGLNSLAGILGTLAKSPFTRFGAGVAVFGGLAYGIFEFIKSIRELGKTETAIKLLGAQGLSNIGENLNRQREQIELIFSGATPSGLLDKINAFREQQKVTNNAIEELGTEEDKRKNLVKKYQEKIAENVLAIQNVDVNAIYNDAGKQINVNPTLFEQFVRLAKNPLFTDEGKLNGVFVDGIKQIAALKGNVGALGSEILSLIEEINKINPAKGEFVRQLQLAQQNREKLEKAINEETTKLIESVVRGTKIEAGTPELTQQIQEQLSGKEFADTLRELIKNGVNKDQLLDVINETLGKGVTSNINVAKEVSRKFFKTIFDPSKRANEQENRQRAVEIAGILADANRDVLAKLRVEGQKINLDVEKEIDDFASKRKDELAKIIGTSEFGKEGSSGQINVALKKLLTLQDLDSFSGGAEFGTPEFITNIVNSFEAQASKLPYVTEAEKGFADRLRQFFDDNVDTIRSVFSKGAAERVKLQSEIKKEQEANGKLISDIRDKLFGFTLEAREEVVRQFPARIGDQVAIDIARMQDDLIKAREDIIDSLQNRGLSEQEKTIIIASMDRILEDLSSVRTKSINDRARDEKDALAREVESLTADFTQTLTDLQAKIATQLQGKSIFPQGNFISDMQQKDIIDIELDFKKQELAIKDLFKSYEKAVAETDADRERINVQLQETLQLLYQNRDAELSFQNSTEGRAQAQVRANDIVLEQYRKMHERTGTFFDGIQYSARKSVNEQTGLFQVGADSFGRIMQGMEDTAANAFLGISGSFKDLLHDMFSDLTRFFAKALVQRFFGQAILSLFPGSGAPTSPSGQFALGFASGGVINSPMPFVNTLPGGSKQLSQAGEAGPEAILPLRRDSSGRLGVYGAGGGGTTLYYSPTIAITMSGESGESDNDSQRKDLLARALDDNLKTTVITVIREQQRPGGLLSSRGTSGGVTV